MWPFRKKTRAEIVPLEPESPRPPAGMGWRPWFEVSERAAYDPPWNYEWVELWRPDWGKPRLTRSEDVPHELTGPGFWWRPYQEGEAGHTVTIEG